MPMNYTTLAGTKDTAGSVKYFVRHTEVPADYILERAQDAIYSMLRVREMVAKAEGTIAENATSLAMPTDLLEPIALYRTGSYRGKIRMLDQDHFESRTGEDENDALYEGVPTECTFDGTTFYFSTKADADYPYRLWYIKKPAYLSVSNETNFLTTRYGNMLEAMVKRYAFEHRNDDAKANEMLQIASGFIEKANMEADNFRQFIQTEMYWSQ